MNRELQLACALAPSRSHDDNSVWLLPISLDGDPIPRFADERHIINEVQHIMMQPSWDEGLRRLAEATLQPTKKRLIETLYGQATELISLELQLFRVQRQVIQAEVSAQMPQPYTGEHSVHASVTTAVESIRSARQKYSWFEVTLGKKRTLYEENVKGFSQKYKEKYDPYLSLAVNLESEKAKLDEAMDREENEAAAEILPGIIFVALIVFIIMYPLVKLLNWLLAALVKWWTGG